MLHKDIRSANVCPNIVVQRGVRKELDNKWSDEANFRDQCVLQLGILIIQTIFRRVRKISKSGY
jgi:hypothetical protein